MRQKLHQDERQTQIGGHRRDRDLDRRGGVVAREKGRRQHLDQDKGRQARGIGGERRGGRRRIGRAEGAALEQHRQDRRARAQPSATAAGKVSSSASSTPRFCVVDGVSRDRPSRTWRDNGGRIAVPTAMPTTPSGNWFSRSA